MSRNLLHKDKLEELKQWLDTQGIEYRPGRGDWQLMQVRQPGRTQWDVIYERLHMPEHVTVTHPLEGLIHRFIKESKSGSKPRDTVRKEIQKQVESGSRHSGGEPSLPWDS